jgi:hypothetical protein
MTNSIGSTIPPATIGPNPTPSTGDMMVGKSKFWQMGPLTKSRFPITGSPALENH